MNYPRTGDWVLIAAGIAAISLSFYFYPVILHSGSRSVHARMSGGEADRQIEEAKKRLASTPDDLDALTALAIASYEKGPDYYVDALNALEKARSLGALNDSLFFYAGVMYGALGLPDYAINEFSKYKRHHPKDYETNLRLANLEFQQRRLDEAVNDYRQALQLWPKDATLWFNYALVAKEKGDYKQAIEALDRVSKYAGGLPEGGFYEEGEVYRLQGNEDKALQDYRHELELHPDYIPALEAMDVVLRHKGDLKQSQEIRKRIMGLKKHS
jgi:tetratricopeptide (TPR) repeat protein